MKHSIETNFLVKKKTFIQSNAPPIEKAHCYLTAISLVDRLDWAVFALAEEHRASTMDLRQTPVSRVSL